MTIEERINLLVQLGKHLQEKGDYLLAVMHRTEYNNAWFTKDNLHQSIDNVVLNLLDESKLQDWVKQYLIQDNSSPKRVGLVLTANVPFEGFQDIINVFISGNQSVIKLADTDKFLFPYFIKWMNEKVPASKAYFEISEKLSQFDAVIATGNQKSMPFLQTYFGKYPHVLRKSRNSVAVLSGNETEVDIIELGKDIFQNFGLGQRNVGKLFLPNGYQFDFLLETLHTHYKRIVLHSKYKNNFDYNYALHLLNQTPFLTNGCMLLLEETELASRIATLHYEFYEDLETLQNTLQQEADKLQCIISPLSLGDLQTYDFGQAQEPTLMEYADKVDTMDFLSKLNELPNK